jgi:hypothetical protein
MTLETFKSITDVIVLTIFFVVFGWEVLVNYPKWFMRNRRADELLRTVLTHEQYSRLKRQGYLDIKSPRHPKRIYRVPRYPGTVRVIEQGRRKASLCLQPKEMVPDADIVVIHKLMIEADEETYLRTANRIPICLDDW